MGLNVCISDKLPGMLMLAVRGHTLRCKGLDQWSQGWQHQHNLGGC